MKYRDVTKINSIKIDKFKSTYNIEVFQTERGRYNIHMTSILKADGITKTFAKEKVIKDISLEIAENTFSVLLGPSGSGKSTLLNILSGLLKPTSGVVSHRGRDIADLSEEALAEWKRSCTGNIFQNYLLLNNLNVRENIEVGINKKCDALDFLQLTKILEIDNLLDKFPAHLSGGQQQRVAIARAVIKKPDILFCDEATGSLDEANSKKVVSLLHSLQKAFGITVLFVTHNLQIAETADRVITIKDGRIFQDLQQENPIRPEEMIWGSI